MNPAVVIPAYNEAETIAEVARRARAHCARVIVVDDGSGDGTADRLDGLDVTLVRNPSNVGKAASLWRGAQAALAAGADGVITLDGDGQHDPDEIPRLLSAARRHPDRIIVAARLRYRERTPPLRLFGNRCANFWISWAAGHRISDSQSGFRLYPAAVFRLVRAPKRRSQSFVFESEILIEGARGGYPTHAIPIEAIYPQTARPSHYRPALDTLLIIRMVAWKLIKWGMYPRGLRRALRR